MSINDINGLGFKIILASQSPRRQFLLNEIGIDFEVLVKSVDESYPALLEAENIAVYLSELKANAFNFNELPGDALLITADTIVWLNGESIGKPDSLDEAKLMLRKLSGQKHLVSTGVCFRTSKHAHSFYVNTDVWFKNLEDNEIEYYVETYKPLDKAGAYGIQEWIGYIGVEKIDGSFFNVMGFPVQQVYEELMKFIKAHK